MTEQRSSDPAARATDAMVMLHIYNFDTAVAGGPAPTPAPTASPAPGMLPDTAGPSQGTSPLAVILVAVAVGALSALSLGMRRSRQSR